MIRLLTHRISKIIFLLWIRTSLFFRPPNIRRTRPINLENRKKIDLFNILPNNFTSCPFAETVLPSSCRTSSSSSLSSDSESVERDGFSFSAIALEFSPSFSSSLTTGLTSFARPNTWGGWSICTLDASIFSAPTVAEDLASSWFAVDSTVFSGTSGSVGFDSVEGELLESGAKDLAGILVWN